MLTFQTFDRLNEKKEDIIKKGKEHGLTAIRIYRSPFAGAENILHFLVDTDEKKSVALEDLGFFQWYLTKELACEVRVKDTESLTDSFKEAIQSNIVSLSSLDKHKIKELFADLVEADSNFELCINEKDQKVNLTVSIPWGQNEKIEDYIGKAVEALNELKNNPQKKLKVTRTEEPSSSSIKTFG